MSTEALLAIAEDIIRLLPHRLQGKYFSLRTALLGAEMRSSAPDFGAVELTPHSRSMDSVPPPVVQVTKAVQCRTRSRDAGVMTDSSGFAVSDLAPILGTLDDVYTLFRQTRMALGTLPSGGDARKQPDDRPPFPTTRLFSNLVEAPNAQAYDQMVLEQIQHGCARLLEEAESCQRNLTQCGEHYSELLATGRISKSTIGNLTKENDKLIAALQERDQRIRSMQAEIALYQQNTAALREQNVTIQHNLQALEERFDSLRRKLGESDSLFKKCNNAYLKSLAEIREAADVQISHLSNQLAVTHDRLRRLRKTVEDLPGDYSGITASLLSDSVIH
ncbi:hypothetical protein GMRT_14218 [Giardia muris]|uniref:Uncharacterized protein n=1 Tax=Giardia muris TaxID=5742 RepID=A0A4Z1T814_GIAMU|nr:hypothetical protein GMRT_14218 [Giardia muris]|eukprot:TNJ30243.1 hypothetical protein GMRT_14218 [Giardia muris]